MLIASVLGLGALSLNIALNIALLPRIGIRGASIASSVCYAGLALSYVVSPDAEGWQGGGTWSRGPRICASCHGVGREVRPRCRRGLRSVRPKGSPVRSEWLSWSEALNRGGTERQIVMLGSALVGRGHR